MNRLFRMVSEQNGKVHVSSVLQPEEEAREHLQAEVEIHIVFGWKVVDEIDGDFILRGKKGTERRVGIREDIRT